MRLRHFRSIFSLSLGVSLLFTLGCPRKEPDKPATGGGSKGGTLSVSPDVYSKMVSTFFTGALAYESSEKLDDIKAIATDFTEKATQLVPEEPAAWVNLALNRAVRQSSLGTAQEAIEKARTLAPNNSEVEGYYGLILARNGKTAEAALHYARALELDPTNVGVRYALAKDADFASGQEAMKSAQEQYTKILETEPRNLTAIVGAMKAAVNRNDATGLRALLPRLSLQQTIFPQGVKDRIKVIEKALNGQTVSQLSPEIGAIGNLLREVSAYKEDTRRLNLDERPLQHFIALPQPTRTPAPADTAMTFTPEPLVSPVGTFDLVKVVSLAPELPDSLSNKFANNPAAKVETRKEEPPTTIYANATQVQLVRGNGKTQTLTFPGGSKKVKPTPEGVTLTDFVYDFLPDFALAGAGGIKLYRQEQSGQFKDVTALSTLPSPVLTGNYVGVSNLDVELDGDLDLFVMPVSGNGIVLRNNGNGTWVALSNELTKIKNPRSFAWGDFDSDGDADAAILDDAGKLVVFNNQRGGVYSRFVEPNVGGKLLAITSADADNDGRLDVVALREDGTILRFSLKPDATGWDIVEIAKWNEAPKDGSARIAFAELDNNGAVDLIATGSAGSAVFLQDADRKFVPLSASLSARSISVSPFSPDGRLTPVGFDAANKPVRLLNKGTKNYAYQDVRPRADFVAPGSSGDGRINSFGILGAMEIRAGLLYQKQPINDSTLHFGLGTYARADCVRILWPNGYPRTEFPDKTNGQMTANTIITAPYRLGGSCPWLFAWNGTKMQMITDCIWRSPLGLKINAFVTANVAQTEDWIKIRGDQMAARDGIYDLRICAELWETHFFDHLSLRVVDHPVGTEVWIDERFSIPAPPLRVITTQKTQPISLAKDDKGADVTETVLKRDGVYLDTFGRGQYQGVTRDHWVEVTLPDRKAEPSDALYLLATGWIHPTDTSINIAISQAGIKPDGLRLETLDASGKWRVAKPGLGFPTGKVKTVVLDLKGVFAPNQPRRLRLRTNLEIYWDQIMWAKAAPNAPLRQTDTTLQTAILDYHGFSQATTKNISSPELADYDVVSSTRPQWLDLEGYYTRFGDILPLLTKTDDRYVIMNAGDEMRLRFEEVKAPEAGWIRDYVLIGDGWVKDGNFNTQYSKTVLPLPTHAKPDYTTPPTTLQNDPVYRLHKADWETYHTRFVDTHDYRDSMKPR